MRVEAWLLPSSSTCGRGGQAGGLHPMAGLRMRAAYGRGRACPASRASSACASAMPQFTLCGQISWQHCPAAPGANPSIGRSCAPY